jgi:hypothetical protein
MRATYEYVFRFASLAPGATATQTKNIQLDADFDWYYGMQLTDILLANVTESSRPIPLISVLITDTQSGYSLSDAPVPIDHWFGSGPLPHVLKSPYRFVKGGTVSLTLANYSTVTTYNVYLTMAGIKVNFGTAAR